jgi:hypothetical protein
LELSNWNIKMLSRGYSNASSRSQNPKSSKPSQTNPLTPLDNRGIDPVTANKQAIAAASFAFELASGRALAAQDVRESDITEAISKEKPVQNGQYLGRKQSIRFTGVTAVSMSNRSITRRVAPENNDLCRLPSGGPHASVAYTSPSPISGTGNSLPSKSVLNGYHVSSMSASNRKLQRAKSMFSLRSSRSIQLRGNRPQKNSQVQRQLSRLPDEHSQLTHITDDRLQRSFSFLRDEKDHLTSGLELHTNKSAITELAREQYLRELDEQKLKEEPISQAASQHRKSHRAFRRSVRSISTNSYDTAIASPSQILKVSALKKGFGYKARSLSLSLKQRLKRVFHRPSDSDATLPIQQLDASRPHFGDYTSTFSGVDQEYQYIPSPDSDTLRKARARESSLSKVSGLLESGSPTKSIRGVRSEDEVSPRMKRGANTAPGNFVASIQSREKKRLSVIQEHGGPHQPSPTAHNHADLGNFFHTPVGSSTTGKQITAFVDSQKMYSALQQKIYENQRLAQPEKYAPERERDTNDAQAKTCGILTALPSFQPLTKVSVDGPFTDYGNKTSKSARAKPRKISGMIDGVHSTEEHSADYSVQEDFLDMYTRFTPQQIAEHNESSGLSPKRPLRETKAAFFPSSMRIERTNISPYRRLMGFGGEIATGIGVEAEENTSIRVRSESAFGSASIYSRTSGGNTPKENKSSLSLAKSESSHERGTAIIITELSRQHEEPRASLTRPNQTPKENGDTQNWMDPNLYQLQSRGLEKIKDFNTLDRKENRHKRENAQIDDGNIEMRKLRAGLHQQKQPPGVLHGKATSQPNLRNQASRSIFTRSPLLDIRQPTMPEGSGRNSPVSPSHHITPRRSLNLTHDKSSSGRRNQGVTVLARTASPGTPKPQVNDSLSNRDRHMLRPSLFISPENTQRDPSQDTRNLPTPMSLCAAFRTKRLATSQTHKSPERLARLRRLQSSNSLKSHNKYELDSSLGELENGQATRRLFNFPSRNPLMKEEILQVEASSMAINDAHSTGVRSMVDSFLNNRRRTIRMNEDSGIGPVFL